MRYNPETERGITLEQISQQCWAAVTNNQPELTAIPARVWDCRNGGWIQTLQTTPIGRPVASIA
jgi:hypothetical protein